MATLAQQLARQAGGVAFMPPVAAPPPVNPAALVRGLGVAQSPGGTMAQRALAASAGRADRIAAMAPAPPPGLKEDAIHGLGWLVGNPVSKAVLKPLSVLDYPRAAVVGTLRQALETGAMDDVDRALAAVTGLKYTPIQRPEGNKAGFQFGELWRDIKKHEGFGASIVEPQFKDANIWLKRAMGFAGDVALDPFTYLSGGTEAAAGLENRFGYANKLLDAQNVAGKEAAAATEAADTAAEWARLMGGTGSEEAVSHTAATAEQAQARLDELSKIGNKDALDVINRRGVNLATPEQLKVMGIEPHAIRFAGVPIPGTEAASEAMSRFLSPGKEAWSRTAGAGMRRVFTPKGDIGQKLAQATERLVTGEGAVSRETALRTHDINQTLRLAKGDFRAPAVQYLHQLGADLKGLSKDEQAQLVKEAEETGVENATTQMAPNMIKVIKSIYEKYAPPGSDIPMPPELLPWKLPNGEMSRYTMPHVLSRDSFRFFNRVKKGENPALDFIRRDLGVTDKDLLEEGGFLQRRVFRPNADGSPQTFKIGADEVTITTGSVAELEDKIGGILRKHGFEGKVYETSPTEAWRRYIKATEKDVAKNAALMKATGYGLEGLIPKPKAPISWDPFGREIKMLPAEGETDPRYVRGEASKTTKPATNVGYEYVEDPVATKARNKIITKGGEKNVHQQVLGEYADTATAERATLAQDIEGTRQHAEQAFDLAREKSAKTMERFQKTADRARAKVDKLEAEYKELLKEGSANQELIDKGVSTIHGIRSQTPKNIKAAIQTRMNEISTELEDARGHLERMHAGLEHALSQSTQEQRDAAIQHTTDLREAYERAEAHLADQTAKAERNLARRIKRETNNQGHVIGEVEAVQAQDVLKDWDASARGMELKTRKANLERSIAEKRTEGNELEAQAKRIEDQLARKRGGSTVRSEARQARIEEADKALAGNARVLRRRAANAHSRANTFEQDLANVEQRIKDDPFHQAERTAQEHLAQQTQIKNWLNPTEGIDVRGARGRLDEARRQGLEHLREKRLTKEAEAAAAVTPLERSAERMTKLVGQEPTVHFHTSKPDDLPGGEEGLHRLLFSIPTAEKKAWASPYDPEFVSSLIWSAKSGEVMMIQVGKEYRRKGIATAMWDYAKNYAEEHGIKPPEHSGNQTDMGKLWAPENDKRVAWWTRNPDNTKGLNSWEATKARDLLDSPKAREYAADESIASHLRDEIARMENPPKDTTPVDWTEVGRKGPVQEPRPLRTWRSHNSNRRRLLGEMEHVRDEAHFTKPGMGEGESFKQAGRRRLKGYEPWWKRNPEPSEETFGRERYPTRIDQSSTKRSRNARLKKLQQDLDKEDAWLAKHPQPPLPKVNEQAKRFTAKINGRTVRLVREGNDWKIILPDRSEQIVKGNKLAEAFRTAEEAGRNFGRDAASDTISPEMSRLRGRLAGAEARMRQADHGAGLLPGRESWEQPYSQTWWRDTKDVFSEELGSVIDENHPLWNDVENMDTLDNSEVTGMIQDEWRRLTPEGQQRLRELGWDNGQAPYSPAQVGQEGFFGGTMPPGWRHPAEAPPISQQVADARRTLSGAAREQSFIEPKPIPPPTPEELIRKRFVPPTARAEERLQQATAASEDTAGQAAQSEAIRSDIQGAANERITGIQNANESLKFQNERLGQMVNDLYTTRMPDPVADWRKAYNDAEGARAVHQQIVDHIEKYSVRQRAIDIVEKNRRAGAPSIKDLERVAANQLRPEDAQGLMRAVDDVSKFMTNADQILPVRTRKEIEAALMAHEQALAALTTTNDLPARALADMTRDAKNGKLPAVLKAQLREGWREVGPDGSILIDKDLERAFFNVEQTLDSKLFGRLFTTWTNFFKTYATLTPGFHVRNAISAIFMNATEGVGPLEQLRAIKLWGEYRRAENPVEWLASRSTAERNAFTATFASGAGGQFLEAGVGEARSAAGKGVERLFSNPATRGSKRLGEWVEGPQRLALGLHSTERGATAGEALGRISRVHFDYSQVSKFDEQMKRIIPFWTFMSRNIPLQFTQMWMKPKMYLRYQSLARNLQLGNKGDTIIPSYIKQGGGIDLGIKTPDLSGVPILGKLAPPGGMPIVAQPDLPQQRYFDDLQRLTSAASGNGLGQMATNLNPMMTVPAEFAGRTDFFTGQNFPADAEVKVGGAATPWAVALSLIGQARRNSKGEWMIDAAALNAIRGLDPNLDRIMRLAPQLSGLETTDKTGASTTARQAESVLRWAGAPIRTISPQQQRSELRSRASKARQQALAAAGR